MEKPRIPYGFFDGSQVSGPQKIHPGIDHHVLLVTPDDVRGIPGVRDRTDPFMNFSLLQVASYYSFRQPIIASAKRQADFFVNLFSTISIFY